MVSVKLLPTGVPIPLRRHRSALALDLDVLSPVPYLGYVST
ncbi:hypothetical protein OCU_06950 [Mycobacterium intracellulare ATCC 13950]|uniref:Uncharacterized protein n=1 Tax=Mycobacterium intracellulare (strain ATCC 13950 / DSM 43223 / JCM 6384 / NCTC 13025 / 3600) TaxID=487521 RepID=H8IQ83_MYCIA|nr:hypothetical protein OCU_06950 [Mycobacterium intracellulare ATCC 13950]